MSFLRPILLSLLLLFAPPALSQTTGTGTPDSAIEVGRSAISDTEIATRIRDVLREMDGYERVSVEVSAGVVTLSGQVLDGTAEDMLVGIVNRVSGVVAIENDLRQSTDLDERLAPAWERLLTRVENGLSLAPIVLVAVASFLVIAALGWVLTTRKGIWKRIAPNAFIADIYRAVARIGFVIFGLLVALDILNATALIGAVFGAAGVAGLALGFAVRDTVENFIASILLSLRQPFRPDDVVEIEGDIGRVARLTSRATILISPDGNHIRIPNATVFKGRIVNYTRDPNRRFTFSLGVDADSDLAGALATATAAIEALPFVLQEPPIGAWIDQVGDSNVVLSFVGWVDQTRTDFLKARGEAIRASKVALEQAGYGLPEPTYRLRIDPQLPFAVEEGPPAHKAQPAAVAARTLPEAALPHRADTATEHAARTERQDEANDNLLVEGRKQE